MNGVQLYVGLEDRAILVWSIGVRRPQHFTAVFPYAEVTQAAEVGEQPARRFSPAVAILDISSPSQSVQVQINKLPGMNLPLFVVGMVTGAVRFDFDDGFGADTRSEVVATQAKTVEVIREQGAAMIEADEAADAIGDVSIPKLQADGGAALPKFCTGCGATLAEVTNFCT